MLFHCQSSYFAYEFVFRIHVCFFLFTSTVIAINGAHKGAQGCFSLARYSTIQQGYISNTCVPPLTTRLTPLYNNHWNDGNNYVNEASKLESQISGGERNLALSLPSIEKNIVKHFDTVKESGTILDVKDLTIWIGDRVLFDNIAFRINRGDCIGIVGNNGTGKTSLLDTLYYRLSGIEPPITTLYASMDIKHFLRPDNVDSRLLNTYQRLHYLAVRGHSLKDSIGMPLDRIWTSDDYSTFVTYTSVFTGGVGLNDDVAYMRQNSVSQLDNSKVVEEAINAPNRINHTRRMIIQDIENNLDYLNNYIDGGYIDSPQVSSDSDSNRSKFEWVKELLFLYNSQHSFVQETCKNVDIMISNLVDMFGLRAALPLRVGELSGGFKMRLHLLTQLISKPKLLLLDEPTNNLDMPSVLFLSSTLKRLIETIGLSVILISHNPQFLNELCSSIFQAPGDGTLSVYSGGFDDFVHKGSNVMGIKTSRLQNLELTLKKLQQQYNAQLESTKGSQKQKRVLLSQKRRLITETENLVERIRGAKKSSYSDAYEKLLLSDAQVNPGNLSHLKLVKRGMYVFPDKPAFDLDNVTVLNKEGEVLLSNVSLTIQNGDRILLLGNNGAGKSTLISLLNAISRASNMGVDDINSVVEDNSHFQVEGGHWRGRGNGIVNTFSQNCSDLLNSKLTVGALAMKFGDLDMSDLEQLSKYLASFHLIDFMDVKVSDLSFGERSRLLLALQFLRNSTFLFLDEPTNHLDVYMQATLSTLLNNVYTKGGIIVATHDMELIKNLERVTGVVYIHERDRMYTFNGDFKEAYMKLRSENPHTSHKELGDFLDSCQHSYKRDIQLIPSNAYTNPVETVVKNKAPKGRKSVSKPKNTPGRAKMKNAKRFT
ncbi:ABC transporter ATP-binding protein family protein [Babesia bovis T2Bo]|uniref:ABC transporter ATP-binding protein n=2 Tax=Babesia bovis TaxID=5865 RepID=A7ARJ9_BABBO|nr:ABC transporter ATP-binding protein family protein [Babesia bovis T2Bo]EDO07168.1 ABC transporter ATP-binding protein family protein [Babesia bovis T2Bo]|eukprot:XP_001610736.1 ABC transporter ATP-binding protein [Babesia bovis T2Bo]